MMKVTCLNELRLYGLRNFFFLCLVLSITSFALASVVIAEYRIEFEISEPVFNEYGEPIPLNRNSVAIERRIDGTFTVVGATVGEWTEVVNRNNLLKANLWFRPTSFASGVAQVDILVSWSDSAKQFNSVAGNVWNTVEIPSNGGRWRLYVRPWTAGGTFT